MGYGLYACALLKSENYRINLDLNLEVFESFLFNLVMIVVTTVFAWRLIDFDFGSWSDEYKTGLITDLGLWTEGHKKGLVADLCVRKMSICQTELW